MPKNNSPHLVYVGDLFGRLKVLSFSHRDKRWRRHYLVECECGKRKTVQGTMLRSGNTKSCGCLSREIRKATILPNNRGVINHIILQYKRHAKDRNIEFKLSYEQVEEIIRKPCFYCGELAGNLKKTKNLKQGFPHNGIDRKENKLPYIFENCVPCCGVCNIAKGIRSAEDFISWAKKIAFAEQWG